jgi:pimeloyl-ACP methyl ester carboxylesterase
LTEPLLVHGRRIEVAWWGEADSSREPIVLLHEGLGSISQWKSVPAEIHAATSRTVMAYSRAGHGRSHPRAQPPTITFMHEEARDELPAVLDAAGIRRAILLGHSDGGSIALIFAATFPARVPALILEAPHVLVEEVSVASIEALGLRWRQTDLRARLGRHHDEVDALFHGWRNVWLDPAFLSWSLEPLLPHIACPVLLIQGRDDEYGTMRQLDTIARAVRGPVERIVLEDCGHSPHLDHPHAVVTAVRDFVAEYVETSV